MGASRYIGRIGGLAVALGIGAAAFIGCGVAIASPAASNSSGDSVGAGPKSASTADAVAKAAPHKSHRSRPSLADSTNPQPKTEASSAAPAKKSTTDVVVSTPSAVKTSTAITTKRTTTSAKPNMVTVLVGVVDGILDPAHHKTPAAPLETPTSWVETAAARREISGAAVNLASPTGPITVSPTLTFSDGIIEGSANATDAKGLPLAYTIVSAPSRGGKITF